MKIAIIGSRGYPYVYSGYETFVKELSERLIGQNIEVTVYCHKNLFTEYPQQVNGIKLIYVPTINAKITAQFVHSLLSMTHACLFGKFDILLAVNSANGPFGILSKLFRIKTLINVDGLEWLRPKWKGLGAKYFYWASKMATKLYDVIITDSDEMQKIYRSEFNANSTVIAYGANLRVSQNKTLIKRWNLEENDYYLIVGRLIPDNNADLIVEEYKKCHSTKKLVIVGDVPYKDTYAEKIKESQQEDDRIIFTGYIKNQDELSELYHASFAYLHGHEFGGTNPTMLKALAYGCAILALETRFNREMLENDKYGVFFSKKENSLSDLIHYVEKHPLLVSELKTKSRERIINNYTWEKILNQYIEVFESLVSNNKKA